jgi:hypothetical protein
MWPLVSRLWEYIWGYTLKLFGVQKQIPPSRQTLESIPSPQEALSSPTATHSEVAPQLELGSDVPPEYRKSKSLFTYRESVLYKALAQAVNNRYQIFVKVRLADFIWLANEPENRKFHQNQILCKHIDFLLCDKVSLAPLLGIELDDSSHKRPGHHERDHFKDGIFRAVGLPLLRMELQSEYSTRFVQEQIDEKLKDKTAEP